jgi:hypothetical protein
VVQAMRRDGQSCPMTGVKFNQSPDDTDFDPILTHVIPNSVHGKVHLICSPLAVRSNTILQPDTLRCIAMLAGTSAIRLIHEHLDGIGNVMNLQSDAHKSFDDLKWGIEAQEDNGTVRA